MKALRTLVQVVAAAATVAACSSITFEGGGPLTLTVTPDRTSVRTGDTVTFSYDAKGSILVGVILDYSDGTKADSVDTAGAQTARGRFKHAFQAPGSYTVVGTVLDNLQGVSTTEVAVTVTAGSLRAATGR